MCIRDRISTVWQTKKAGESLRNLETRDDSTCKMSLSEWSDGFDPNSASKNNRGSMHIASFSLLGHKNRNDPNLSFPSTISKDNSNHTDTQRKVYDDLKSLRKHTEFWNGKEFIKVQVAFFLPHRIAQNEQKPPAMDAAMQSAAVVWDGCLHLTICFCPVKHATASDVMML